MSDRCHSVLAPCSLVGKGSFSETGGGQQRTVPCSTNHEESAMKPFYDDVAAALVTVTYAIAGVSMLVAVLAGVV